MEDDEEWYYGPSYIPGSKWVIVFLIIAFGPFVLGSLMPDDWGKVWDKINPGTPFFLALGAFGILWSVVMSFLARRWDTRGWPMAMAGILFFLGTVFPFTNRPFFMAFFDGHMDLVPIFSVHMVITAAYFVYRGFH